MAKPKRELYLGTNRLPQYVTGSHEDRHDTEAQIEAEMEKRIEQVHRRLLERATGGLLTWQGDHIVPGQGRSSRTRLSIAPTIYTRLSGVDESLAVTAPADADMVESDVMAHAEDVS